MMAILNYDEYSSDGEQLTAFINAARRDMQTTQGLIVLCVFYLEFIHTQH